MIPNQKVAEVQSTLEGRVVEMTIDQKALKHIMGILTGLYSDPEMALIREYSTNALDEHIKAGNPLPIEVTTPTLLYPFLVIKDTGTGLNAEGIADVYSKYGKSTKNDSNDYTGSLGIGCKSALAYTNQFTIVGIKGGVKTTVSASRDGSGSGTMTIVDEVETDEANGVEIIIPAKTLNRFKERAEFFFKFWKKSTVMLNGEEPAVFEGISITDDILLVKGAKGIKGLPISDYVVMGNVPYPIDRSYCDFEMKDGYAIIARVPIGSVDFAGTREALDYCKLTKDTLAQLKDTTHVNLLKAISREMDKATTCYGALSIALEWRNSLGNALSGQLKYRSLELPDEIMLPGKDDVFTVTAGKQVIDYNKNRPTKLAKNQRMPSINLVAVPKAIWVYGFDRTFTPACKKKLWHRCDELILDYPEQFILCKDKPTSPWIDPSKIWQWKPIEDIKLPKETKAGNVIERLACSYDLYIGCGGTVDFYENIPADDICTQFPIYYVVCTPGDIQYYDVVRSQALTLLNIEDSFTLVRFSSNRENKFRRLFPQAKSFQASMNEYVEWWVESLTRTDKLLLALRRAQANVGYPLREVVRLPYSVKDPRIRETRHLLATDKKYVDYLESIYSVLSAYMYGRLQAWRNPLQDYPLFGKDYIDPSKQDLIYQHRVAYMNAVYDAGLIQP